MPVFRFKQFSISDENTAMKVGTDAVLLGSWVEINTPQTILDIGTGSGILALMMAQRSDANIDAVEIDEMAAQQAALNFIHSTWAKRLHVHSIAFQQFAKDTVRSYDLVISNPPFFSKSLKPSEPERCVARHDDLLPVNEFISGTAKLLTPAGTLALIIPVNVENTWVSTALTHGLFTVRRTLVVPRSGKCAARVMIEFQTQCPTKIREDFLVIRNEDGSYTSDYKNLTFDFYLGLP